MTKASKSLILMKNVQIRYTQVVWGDLMLMTAFCMVEPVRIILKKVPKKHKDMTIFALFLFLPFLKSYWTMLTWYTLWNLNLNGGKVFKNLKLSGVVDIHPCGVCLILVFPFECIIHDQEDSIIQFGIRNINFNEHLPLSTLGIEVT